jgi:ribosomal-protein-alanine N-acetyltransferase
MSASAWQIRPMERRDLEAVQHIQSGAPETSHWNPADYLDQQSFIAESGGQVVGFAVARLLPPDEVEVLNIATDPVLRRKGIGNSLLQTLLALPGRFVLLEVRASNRAAQALYERAGFVKVGKRKNYYPAIQIDDETREDAVVMKMQKW